MNWCKEMFGTEKPIIALLHLSAFPGDPLFQSGDSMKKTVEAARKDLIALQDGGVDGILFSNEFSLPYQRHIDYIGPAAMARVIGELMSEIHVPFGIDCESDSLAAIDLAAAVDANFVRATFTGVYAGDIGITEPDIAAVLRRKKQLGLDHLKLFYFLNNESDEYIVEREITAIAKSIIFTCRPDGFCVMGAYAGQEASTQWLNDVRNYTGNVPVFCGTGCKAQTVASKLAVSDGAFVGTTFKADGNFDNHVDPQRVFEFMEQVKLYRSQL